MNKHINRKFITLQSFFSNSFNKETDLKNFNETYIMKECLNGIYLICKDLNLIQENNINVYCTSCLYFIKILKNKNFLDSLLICKKIKNKWNINLKKNLLDLLLCCIQWASKICTMEDNLRVKDIFSKVDNLLNYKGSSFWYDCNINKNDLKEIKNDLEKTGFMNTYFIEFLIDNLTVCLFDVLKIMIKKNYTSQLFYILKGHIISIYKNPHFCLFSIFELSLLISLSFQTKTNLESSILNCIIINNNNEKLLFDTLIEKIKTNWQLHYKDKMLIKNFKNEIDYIDSDEEMEETKDFSTIFNKLDNTNLCKIIKSLSTTLNF